MMDNVEKEAIDLPEFFRRLVSVEHWKNHLFNAPCVKTGYVTGAGCSALMVAHKLRLYRGNLSHAISAGTLTFLITSSLGFFRCMSLYNERQIKQEQLRRGMKAQNFKEVPKNGEFPPPRPF